MVSKYYPESEFYTPERCYIVELHNCEEDESCSIARARVSPGVRTQLHALRGIDERYLILEGEGSVEIGGGPHVPVTMFDTVAIPAGVSQRITNTGKSDLIFLCVCTPRFRPEAYIDLSRDQEDD